MLLAPRFCILSKLNFTAEASKVVPSWNFTPGLSLNTYCVLSGDMFQEVAKSGPMLASALTFTKSLNKFCSAQAPWIPDCTTTKSRLGSDPPPAMTIVPPYRGPALDEVPDEVL